MDESIRDDDPAALRRVAESERIAALDVIRGIAILSILFMNIGGMGSYQITTHDFRYPTWTPADWWAQLALMSAVDGTQRGLLELLFGAGIMIMARRAMTPDGPVAVADLHFRRNLLLCLLGLFNAFVLMWWGDILLTYGLGACVLFTFRLWRPSRQLALGAALIALLVGMTALQYRESEAKRVHVAQLIRDDAAHKKLGKEDAEALANYRSRLGRMHSLPRQNASSMERIAKADKAHRSGFAAYWQAQLENWKTLMGVFWPIEAEIVGTMLIGMALFQWGVIQGRARTATYAAFAIGGYGLGLALRVPLWIVILNKFDPVMYPVEILTDVARLAVTLGHLGAIHLALRTAPGRRVLRAFEAPGRMPLTVYLGTSLLMMWIVFPPWGLGMFGRWGVAQMTAVAALVIAGECLAANVWLRHYHTGPFEWLWKSLAYQRRQPFRREERVRTAPVIAAG